MSDNHNEAPENCTHDCSTCGEVCAQHEPESLQQPLRPGSRVDKVIAVVSGKGGVGKSLVTSLLACEMQRRGHQGAAEQRHHRKDADKFLRYRQVKKPLFEAGEHKERILYT